MTPPGHARRPAPTPVLATLALVALSLAASACALVVPAAWRIGSPVPLSGPMSEDDSLALELKGVDTAELVRAADADEARMIELAADTGTDVVVEERITEARRIAARLPAIRAELRARGVRDANERVRHPTIR